jgi:hypothetical protein
VVLLVLTPLVVRGVAGTRVLAYFFAILMLVNAGGHTLSTIFGQTVSTVTFPRPAPGILVIAIYGGGCNLLAGAASQFGSAQGR